MKTKHTWPQKLKHYALSWLGAGVGYEQEAGPVGRALSDSGYGVSAKGALSLAAVWRCTRLVSETIATLPLGLYERKPDGTRGTANELPVANLIAMRPNATMSASTFWECLVGQAVLLGNGFAEKKMMGGRVVSLELMSADRMTWRRLPSGSYEYVFVTANGERRVLSESQVFHLPGFTMWGKFGMSVIRYGAQVFGSALSANQAANSTFKNGLLPTTYFKFPKVLKKDQREDARTAINTISGAINAGQPAILEAEMDVGTIGIKPQDAQLLESRGFSGEEICRWFGIPAVMAGYGDKSSSWASSSEQLNLWFLQYCLRPWLKRIEQAIWKDLLSPAEQSRYYAEFQVEGLLRADTTARVAFYAAMLRNGVMNRTTVAQLENLPAPEGGDVYTVESNLVPLDQLGQQPEGVAVQDALKNFLGLTGVKAP